MTPFGLAKDLNRNGLVFSELQSQTQLMRDVKRFHQLRSARADLQNPYAYMDELEEFAEETPLHRSGNPYASLSIIEDDDIPHYISGIENTAVQLAANPPKPSISAKPFLAKETFRRRATRIFEGYVPRHQQRRIKPHHRHFIERNEDRPGDVRWRLAAELSRYDLSDLKAVRPHFNRELPDDLSENKLLEMEAKVLAEFLDP